MAGRRFIFDPPDRFVAGAVGRPGQRSFFLQATKGSSVLSVALEKLQVALLAERIAQLVEGVAGDPKPDPGPSGLREPVVEAFRVGTMSLAYDHDRGALTIEALEIGTGEEEPGDPDDADEPAGHVLRVRMSLAEARRFAEDAVVLLAAGRPPCPICGEPLEEQGHICLRRNGYVQ